MKLLEAFLLLEGGAALKGTDSITQAEAKLCLTSLIKRVADELQIGRDKVSLIGSAGKKDREEALSGDIDLAVEVGPAEASAAMMNLAYDHKTYRAMRGLNVFAFGYKIPGKIIQVDLMPVKNLSYATWAMQANVDDLSQGLKGAHRNELFFAVAKNANQIKRDTDDDGEIDEIERHFYDLTKGLMRGTQSKKGKKQLLKSYHTIEKNLVSDDPDEVCKLLFNRSAKRCSTFDGVLDAILDAKFPYADVRKDILAMAAEGLKKKGLKVPSSLDGRV